MSYNDTRYTQTKRSRYKAIQDTSRYQVPYNTRNTTIQDNYDCEYKTVPIQYVKNTYDTKYDTRRKTTTDEI